MHTERKLLIIGPAWVGDMVMAQTLFKLIKQHEPLLNIDVLAPEWSCPLLTRMPEVRQAIAMPVSHGQFRLRERYKIGLALRTEQYDQAIVLPNSWKSALIPFFANIKKRTGWRGEARFGLLNDLHYLNKQKLPLMIQRFAALGLAKNIVLPETLPFPALITDHKNLPHTLQKFNLDARNKPILILCPGAEFGPAKRWPEEHYAEIARQKLAEGWQIWLLGSSKDQLVASAIQQLTQQHCIDLTGKTTLGEAIDLMSLANAVVSNDSGLMHIAAALKRPLVVLYGSSDPRFTPPLSNTVKILMEGLDCSPCFQRECPLQHLKCLRDLKPDRVMLALRELETCAY